MSLRLSSFTISLVFVVASVFAVRAAGQQARPAASGARILLLPRRIVSGERATLAVLDVNGRLTPGVTVNFSNGDRFTTDATGRALFVAPLNPGVIYGSIAGRTGRVSTAILSSSEAASVSIEISSAPRVASLTDRFEILGRGFCGDADANLVTIAGQQTIVLASSPTALVALPPPDLLAGTATVQVSCVKRESAPFSVRASARHDDEDCARSQEPGAGNRGTFWRQSGARVQQRRRGKLSKVRSAGAEERQLPDFDPPVAHAGTARAGESAAVRPRHPLPPA